MSSKNVFININSLNISFTEFETIVWNQTSLDGIKQRKYLSNEFVYNEEIAIQLIRYLNQQMSPIFIINRWTNDVFDKKKKYDAALFWLRILLNNEVSVVFPNITENPEFIENIRKMSAPIYSKLMKNLQNF